jgi:uncharacterized protein
MMDKAKLIKLDAIIRDLESFVVAFSGGVDSSFLLHRASSAGNTRVLAVTVRTPFMPDRDISDASRFTSTYNIKHEIVNIPFQEILRNNPPDRCYLCKKILFKAIAATALEHGYKYIVDGTNRDDRHDTRPGLKALEEMSVRSPLAEADLSKEDIRELSRKENLPTRDKPASACLMTRIPYDTEVSERMLKMIEIAEDFLFEKGYPGTRVRVHGDVIRIECLPGYLEKIITDPARENIVANLKKIGFRYVSLDMEGYRSGSMNPEITNYDS